MTGRKFKFAIDRGGTFTDVYCLCWNAHQNEGHYYPRTMKLLSEDPFNYKDAPTEAIRRILEQETGLCFPKGEPIDASFVESIRMGTTVATNALLERKGEPMVLLITKGFKDLLYIGNQCRPNLFDLSVTLPDTLYEEVIEVDERLYLHQDDCQLGLDSTHQTVLGTNGEKLIVERPLDVKALRGQLQRVFDQGIKSIAVVLMHSYIYPKHEVQIEKLAREIGFSQVSLSSEVMPMIRMVPRGYTVCVDAYLTPAIKQYLSNFESGFKDLYAHTKVQFMQSDGGLTPVEKFSGSRAILSGPAGGVVGYATSLYDDLKVAPVLTELDEPTTFPLIGFDMGGTSTDVSRYAGSLEHIFECTTAGVTIQAPQLDINTVAAGGGSRLFFRSGLFAVGPESAGAHPGPACYRKGGPLTITDANLVLNRLIPGCFPKIFGPNCDEALNRDESVKAFEVLTQQINEEISPQKMTMEQVALGFIKVANEAMCRPIRALTQGKGYDTSKHVLACFGGAGGQHACAIAQSLGMNRIVIHKYAGILSAYGMARADVVVESQKPMNVVYGENSFDPLAESFTTQINTCVVRQLKDQGFAETSIEVELYLNLRYDKTDCSLMVAATQMPLSFTHLKIDQILLKKFLYNFTSKYKTEFGFSLSDRDIIVDDVRVRGIGKSRIPSEYNASTVSQSQSNVTKDSSVSPSHLYNESSIRCYFNEQYFETGVYLIEKIEVEKRLDGPCVVIDKLSTIVIEPNCWAYVDKLGNVVINVSKVEQQSRLQSKIDSSKVDFVELSIFSHRFMSIAEQMGRVLQKTAISTNIKERLDFSCAMFGPDGGLVANAPHIPVHLGAMQETVRYQMDALKHDLHPGDVILTNHPQCGGSHLPDLTVITPVFFDDSTTSDPVFFVASRGHHADIGGITPGSMPPFSTQLAEEGAVFETFKVVNKGHFEEAKLIEKFQEPANKVPGSSASRNIKDNIADVNAQIAANNKGIGLIKDLIKEYGLEVVQSYMEFIRSNAETAVRNVLKELHVRTGGKSLECSDKLDNGATIRVKISINGDSGGAVVDFEGTSPEVNGNQCAPRAVCMSALIYCLRSLVKYDIPLNQGCLQPIEVNIPHRCLMDPGPNTAVVGGNVTTSQRIVDVVLKAFEACADSNGCMNNVTFGNEKFGYYETVAGGSGAGPNWNGRSGIHTHMTNTRITDPEIVEKYYPVILKCFQLREDGSGGAGQFKGGEGVIRNIQFREPVTLSLLTERRVLEPRGIKGGQNAKCGENILMRNDGSVLYLGPKVSMNVKPGEILMLKTPGGGGYGLPSEEHNAKMNKMESGVAKCGEKVSVKSHVQFESRGSLNQYKYTQESA